MAVNLLDIRAAVRTYLDTKVVVSISALAPAVPGTINPAEDFAFSITASNAAAAAGGIRLVNVSYHLSVANATVAQFIVPPTSVATARSGPSSLSPPLAPGALVSTMYLFHRDNDLDVGEFDTVANLKGRSGNGVGTTQISAHVHGNPDPDFIFPKAETSPDGVRTVNVV